VQAVEAAGGSAIDDTQSAALYFALSLLRLGRDVRGCLAKLRGVASALQFCCTNSLDFAPSLGATTGSVAGQLCVAVFGRDERSGSDEFALSQSVVDDM
jgi:hypothetical protein